MATQPLTTCMKGLFLIFNFVFWLTGLALLVVGILVKYSFSYLIKLSTDINYNLAPYIMIGCGVFIVLVGFMGCWAAIKEHSWALKMYMFVLIVLFLVEVGAGIAGYILRDKMTKGLKDGMYKAVDTYSSDRDSKSAMDKVQEKIVKCCGVVSYKDYTGGRSCNSSTTSKNVTWGVPKSCCENPDGTNCEYKDVCKDSGSPDKLGIHLKGCYDTLVEEAKEKFAIIGGVALGIAVFQILGVICAYILTKQFRETSRYETM